MLIGRKNNSITWSVPSNDYPVEPFGDPHWSSALGDAAILDFRVQMATSENFMETKAHWYTIFYFMAVNMACDEVLKTHRCIVHA